ncbi:hypothetical protein [Puniceibacterium sediminis]|uniref:Uncharacterized protein n=1 Tax=Puniceibacterium sediminis TaxID=1608407 RepID=A0A238ZMH5_9RHOB|nr:hypothetical protein [Puniceibacterium sediminis]SNR84567.1 hypothetical protein SAMN06265370_13516 [Puniceibacterium sediminis]
MAKAIEITKTARGAEIAFPFEYKDAFKAQFPRAKWNADNKTWSVGKASVARLEQLAALVEERYADRLEREEREMTAEEIEKLRRELANADRNIISTRKAVEDLEIARAEIKAMKAGLESKHEELAAIRSERDDAAAAVEQERASVHAIVAHVVDIEDIEAARGEMRRHMKIAKAWASEKYDEAEARLREMRDRLRAAGIECEAVNLALRANRNRPDRDFDNLLGPLDFEVA